MISNRNGRALEFALVEALIKTFPNSILVGNTSQDQIRDKELFEQLTNEMKGYYNLHCEKFARWVSLNKISTGNGAVTIHRLSDQDAVAGDVTDIRLCSGVSTYNISLKHNHNAVKHQRPGNLFSQLGIGNGTSEQQYRMAIKAISDDFYRKASGVNTNLFSVVKSYDEKIINDFYSDMCALVANTINTQPVDVNHAFRFLVGNCDFDKVIVTKDAIEVMQFSHITPPTEVSALQTSYNRVQLAFNNDFIFDMRLHTASSRFEPGKAISQKFDTQLTNAQIESFYLS